MKEIEVKAKITNINELKEKLIALGCVFWPYLIQEDSIFLPDGIEFWDKTKGTPILKIRDSNGECTLALKKRVFSENELIKLRSNVWIDDKQKAIDIIEHIWFHKVMVLNKRRTKGTYQDMTISLDEVKDLGTFIEVEKLSDDWNSEEIQASLFTFLQTLGISEEDRVKKSYDNLLNEKRWMEDMAN